MLGLASKGEAEEPSAGEHQPRYTEFETRFLLPVLQVGRWNIRICYVFQKRKSLAETVHLSRRGSRVRREMSEGFPSLPRMDMSEGAHSIKSQKGQPSQCHPYLVDSV